MTESLSNVSLSVFLGSCIKRLRQSGSTTCSWLQKRRHTQVEISNGPIPIGEDELGRSGNDCDSLVVECNNDT